MQSYAISDALERNMKKMSNRNPKTVTVFTDLYDASTKILDAKKRLNRGAIQDLID